MSYTITDDFKNIDGYDTSIKIKIEGEHIPLSDLIATYKKNQKIKKCLNKSALKYYYKNSDHILKRMKNNYGEKKYNCECGATVINKFQHLQSKKHNRFMENK